MKNVVCILVVLAAVPCQARIITVGDGRVDFVTIQAAIDDANDGDTVQIRPGTYTGPGNIEIDFLGKAITVTSMGPADASIVASTIIDCNGLGRGFYFHSNEDANSVLAGLTITNGIANNGSSWLEGGAIRCEDSSPVITGCTMTNCTAGKGGAVQFRRGNAKITDCTIAGNTAEHGAGIYVASDSYVTIDNCLVKSNSTFDDGFFRGGGIYISYAYESVIKNCVIVGNITPFIGEGGGIYCIGGTVIITNCTITGNYGDRGSGICSSQRAHPIISNCIVWGNLAEQIVLHNCEDSNVPASISYSNIQGGEAGIENSGSCQYEWGKGNINTDPCFAASGYWDDYTWIDGNDYHLKSQGGRYDPNGQSWVIDDVTSGCIDAVDRLSPLGPEPFPNGGIINMGAYGGTIEASKSYFGGPPCETIVAGDINGDCRVDAKDFALLAWPWYIDNNPYPPGQATEPYPVDEASYYSTLVLLNWSRSAGATSHDIYFGTESPGSFRGNQAETTFDPGRLSYGTEYYWRIDEVNQYGTTTGTVWRFTALNSR